MRLLLIFPLILHACFGEVISTGDKKFRCPMLAGGNKHKFDVDKFLGVWNGVERFSHTENDTASDTCMRLKIIEVNERREEIEYEKPTDLYNYLLSLRYLRLHFTHPGISMSHFVTINMTNVGLWNGDQLTVQVLKFDGNQTLLMICDPNIARVSTVLMNRDADSHVTNQKLNLLLQAKKLEVYSTTSLRTNCSLIEETDEDSLSAGRTAHISLISILVLFLARFLMS